MLVVNTLIADACIFAFLPPAQNSATDGGSGVDHAEVAAAALGAFETALLVGWVACPLLRPLFAMFV